MMDTTELIHWYARYCHTQVALSGQRGSNHMWYRGPLRQMMWAGSRVNETLHEGWG